MLRKNIWHFFQWQLSLLYPVLSLSVKNSKNRAITDLNAPDGSRDIPFQSQEFKKDGHGHFIGFQLHFHLNMTSQRQSLILIKRISLHYKFRSIIDKTKGLLFKQKCFKKKFETIKFNCNCRQYHSSYCEETVVLCFWTKDEYSRFSRHSNKIWNQAKFLCLLITACKLSNKSKQSLLRYCTFIFSVSWRIASVTSYLSENEAKNLQNGDVHLAQIADFEMEYREPFGALSSVMAHFLHFSPSSIWA